MRNRRPFAWGERLPTLTGRDLSLRPLDDEDLPALQRIFGDAEVARYLSRPAFASPADAEAYLEDIRIGFRDKQLFQWGIVAEPEQQLSGTCTLFAFDREGFRCELGFALARQVWGRGIARCAVAAVLRFAFEELGVHRIEADTDPRNERSLRLLERLGFEREGLLRQRYCVGDELQDSVVLGLLYPSWQARGG